VQHRVVGQKQMVMPSETGTRDMKKKKEIQQKLDKLWECRSTEVEKLVQAAEEGNEQTRIEAIVSISSYENGIKMLNWVLGETK
jgi:hypothetical protein